MNVLHPAPEGFDDILRVFAMARLVPTTHHYALRLGLVFDGLLFATCELDGYRQVKFFCEHLRKMGWREHLLGAEAEMFDCDLLFSQPALDCGQRDPSFIRKPVMTRWPAQS